MSTVTGVATTFDLPNYHGELIAVTPADTPLLSMSGGISEAGQTTSPLFEWQTEDLRDPEIRARVEGADAPDGESRARSNVSNVCQIFQEAVETSYSSMAARGMYATAKADGSPNPIQDEHAHQVLNALKTVARDVNYSFWHGVGGTIPGSNATARQTNGLLAAITTNRSADDEVTGLSAATDTVSETSTGLSNGDKIVFTSVGASTAIRTDRVYYVVNKTTDAFKVSATLGGSAITIGTATVAYIPADDTLTETTLDVLMQDVFDNGGITEAESATLFVPSRQKRAISAAYADAYGKTDLFSNTRNVAGRNVQTIDTNFGTLNVVIDRALPPDALVVASLEQIRPVFLNIPGKGVLFEEELAKTGAAERTQIYGEVGLKYGNEAAHGVIRGLAV